MLSSILCIYSSTIASVVAITIAFIIFGKSWGDLPKIYAAFVIYLQENFGIELNKEQPLGRRQKIIERRHCGRFVDPLVARYCPNKEIINENNNVIDFEEQSEFELLEIQAEIIQAGVEAIIQVSLKSN